MTELRLFVYGTLMRGERAHHRLRHRGFVARARTLPEWTLVEVGWYPGLVAGGATAVAGEIYRIDAAILADLDAYEGRDYTRTRIELADGSHAITYVMNARAAGGCPPIESGDWRHVNGTAD